MINENPPALIDHCRISLAGEVLNIVSYWTVDFCPIRPADIQEVWPEPADGILGYVGQRLAHGGTKQKGAYSFVHTGNVAAKRRLGFDAT